MNCIKKSFFFSEAQLRSELERCQFCQEKPCLEACPSHCSPADFIMAARVGKSHDFGRAAAQILSENPFGETCGLVCPDTFCMEACSRKLFDSPINIPKVQASIVHYARKQNAIPAMEKPTPQDEKIAIIGAGPAGLSAAAYLARKGYLITVFESQNEAGGACRLIPNTRLPKESLQSDINFILSLGRVTLKTNSSTESAGELLAQGFSAVLIAEGQQTCTTLGVAGEDDCAISYQEYLRNSKKYHGAKKAAIIGGGAVAVDCAVVAKQLGAHHTEMFVRRSIKDMPLTQSERDLILEHEIDITTRTRIESFVREPGNSVLIRTVKTEPASPTPNEKKMVDIPGTTTSRPGFDIVVLAIGANKPHYSQKHPNVFYAGDNCNGETTVVEAAASGKNAAIEIEAFLSQTTEKRKAEIDAIKKEGTRSKIKSRSKLSKITSLPVPLKTEFFGIPLRSPFLLSAAPHTDGFEQMKKAFDAGWAGGIMKTAFDGLPIHIPNEYMFTFGEKTFGNCDNVSGHTLSRVAIEIERLRRLYPDRLVAGSTGGAVTGNETHDRHSWQSNTKILENAGSMLVEYSLSCPQGGDGSDGAIVSQNAALAAKIVNYVMEVSDPSIPKLFKLSGAVTSIQVIVRALQEVFARYPHKKAGITLANSFPALGFRSAPTQRWDEGVVVGLSGEGVAPISYLTLANVGNMGVTISGNGGPMDYHMSANFLALGVKTVQFCTIAMKYGVNIVDDLHSGLSHLLQAQGYASVPDFIGCALPRPITDFMNLSPEKKISDRNSALCVRCGNCTHCGYQAISMGKDGFPVTDPSKCIGCSICVKTCFTGAMIMRERTIAEAKVTPE